MKENENNLIKFVYSQLPADRRFNWKLSRYVSVNSNWVHPPGQPPEISSKNLPGGRDLAFESCPETGIRQGSGFCGKWNRNFKRIAWIKFLRVKTKKYNFWPFKRFTLYVFFQWNFAWSMGQFFGFAVTHTSQKIWGVAPGLFIWSFHWVIVIISYFLHKRLWLY